MKEVIEISAWGGGSWDSKWCRFALRCPLVKFLGAIDSYVYAWYACKIFFHHFHFLSPSEPSKVKNHAQNSLFRGVKNHGFWHGFLLSRARRVTKNEKDEKIFSEHVRHTRSYWLRPKTWPTGIAEQNGTTLNLMTPPPHAEISITSFIWKRKSNPPQKYRNL